MSNTNQKEKIPTRQLPTKFVLFARALIGGYLIYTSASLIDSVFQGEGRDVYFFGIAMVGFAIIGIMLIIFSARNYMIGKYVGGSLDAGEEVENDVLDITEQIKSESDDKE